MPRRILISAGDPSGDILACGLVRELRRCVSGLEIWAIGGTQMRREADHFIQDLASLGLMGWVDPLLKIPKLWATMRRIRQILRSQKPDLVIVVDYYGFNIRVAQAAWAAGIPVIYYVSPQVWASRENRVRLIRRYVRRVLCLYPFEKSFYEKHGVSAFFVGHPLAYQLTMKFPQPNGVTKIAILPGSRRYEISSHMPVLLDAWSRLRSHHSELRGTLYVVEGLEAFYPDEAVLNQMGISSVLGPDYEGRASMHLALTASGTATLENMLLGLPQIVFYAVKPWWLLPVLKRIVRTPFIAMPNILAGAPIVDEVAWGVSEKANRKTAQYIASSAQRLIQSPQAREEARQNYARLAQSLRPSDKHPYETAAQAVLETLK